MPSDRGLKDFENNPKLLKVWLKAGNKWMQNRKSESKKFNDAYEIMVHNLFFDTYEDFRLAANGMFGKVDCNKFLEQYFKITL